MANSEDTKQRTKIRMTFPQRKAVDALMAANLEILSSEEPKLCRYLNGYDDERVIKEAAPEFTGSYKTVGEHRLRYYGRLAEKIAAPSHDLTELQTRYDYLHQAHLYLADAHLQLNSDFTALLNSLGTNIQDVRKKSK